MAAAVGRTEFRGRGRGIGTWLLAAVENRTTSHGLNKLSTLMPETETRVEAFLGSGFVVKRTHYVGELSGYYVAENSG